MTGRHTGRGRYASCWAELAVVLLAVAAIAVTVGITAGPRAVLAAVALLIGLTAAGAVELLCLLADRTRTARHHQARRRAGLDHVDTTAVEGQALDHLAHRLDQEARPMAMRIRADHVAQALADAGHQESEYDPAHESPDPGYRAFQHGPRAVAVVHDGPGAADGLETYTAVLRWLDYHVIPDRPQGQRPRLIVTRP